MMKHKFLYTALLLLGLAACTDWTDHYGESASGDGASLGNSLYHQISRHDELSDFKAVLDSVHVYVNNRRSALHYSDMLASDQFYTVFAPQNGSFNRDSLLELCTTELGDSLVGKHFLANHIARYAHSSGANKQVMMLSGKSLHLAGNYMNGAGLLDANLTADNGILHVLKTDYQYHYSIYECLVSLDKYKHIGDFLRSYQTEEFDPVNSLEKGVEDGRVVYADSVFVTYNPVLYRLDAIDCEDSTFMMFVPSAALWQKLHAESMEYYTYGKKSDPADVQQKDSMQNYWSHYALMQDLVYNPIWQTSIRDSVISTTGSRHTYPYHVYYRPYDEGGLMSYVTDSVICSNGVIYEMDEWPFDNHMLYNRTIEKQAESSRTEKYGSSNTFSAVTVNIAADSVSAGAYLDVSSQVATDDYELTFELPGVLRGDYDIYVVYLPKTVGDPNLDPNSNKVNDIMAFKPCKFLVDITYLGTNDTTYTVSTRSKYIIDPNSPSYYVLDKNNGDFIMQCNHNETNNKSRAFKTNPYNVDSVFIANFHFPACNYAQAQCKTLLKITNAVTKSENTIKDGGCNGSRMYIDEILLIPHKDETQQ